jgi:hypothetical protein
MGHGVGSMSEQRRYSSAGRLAEQAQSLRDRLVANQNGSLGEHIQDFFGGGTDWGRGIRAFTRLVETVRSELGLLSQMRRPKWEEALTAVGAVVNPIIFASPAQAVTNNHLPQLMIERLEAVDEALIQAGRCYSYDEARLVSLVGDLDDLIAALDGEGGTAADEFVIGQLSELRMVLLNFGLYGPEGAKAAVAAIVGATAMRFEAGVPDEARAGLRRLLLFLKSASHIAIYAHETYQAIKWGGQLLGLGSGPID